MSTSGVITPTKFDRLVETSGGKYNLSVLLQRRVVELTRGARPLVETKATHPIDIAMEEAYQGKIKIAADAAAAEVQTG